MRKQCIMETRKISDTSPIPIAANRRQAQQQRERTACSLALLQRPTLASRPLCLFPSSSRRTQVNMYPFLRSPRPRKLEPFVTSIEESRHPQLSTVRIMYHSPPTSFVCTMSVYLMYLCALSSDDSGMTMPRRLLTVLLRQLFDFDNYNAKQLELVITHTFSETTCFRMTPKNPAILPSLRSSFLVCLYDKLITLYVFLFRSATSCIPCATRLQSSQPSFWKNRVRFAAHRWRRPSSI
jgi:hypothetical protein